MSKLVWHRSDGGMDNECEDTHAFYTDNPNGDYRMLQIEFKDWGTSIEEVAQLVSDYLDKTK